MPTPQIDHASEYLEQLADEVLRYNSRLDEDAGFNIALAGPLRDVLQARYDLVKALHHLPDEEQIAYGLAEADALLIQRVLRLVADAPINHLEASAVNVELHKDGRMPEAYAAFMQSRHGSDEQSRNSGRAVLDTLLEKYFRRGRKWIKSSIDQWVQPRPRF